MTFLLCFLFKSKAKQSIYYINLYIFIILMILNSHDFMSDLKRINLLVIVIPNIYLYCIYYFNKSQFQLCFSQRVPRFIRTSRGGHITFLQSVSDMGFNLD